MVKISHSFVLIAAVHAAEDADAMLQVGKHAPALAQTASTARASRHQQALQMESNFEKLAAEAVRTGETPSLDAGARSAVDSALETLEDELKKEKIANDEEMDGAIAKFAVCNTAREHAFTNGVDDLNSTVEEAKKKHAKCRLDFEDPNCGDEKTNCDGQDEYAREAHDAGPECVCEAFTTAGTQKVCLERAVKWGAEYNTALGNKIKACDEATKVASKVAQVCDGDQKTYEFAVCQYKVDLTTTCESHSVCYEDAVSNLDTVTGNVKKKEESEKIMWKSCEKVKCYLEMLDASQVSQDGFNKCKDLVTDTKHLDIIYEDAPEMEVCDTDPVSIVPGDPAWFQAQYASLAPTRPWKPIRHGIEDVTPCPLQTSLVIPTQPTERVRLGENGGGIQVPQQMIVEPEASVTADKNKYFKNPVKNGMYGGWCTCPDGAKYDVSDNGDHCGSLQCQGGQAGDCERVNKQSRQGFKVECSL